MIRCLCEEKPKLSDVSLAQSEFVYNSAINSSTGFSPLEVVYKTSPKNVVDLVDLPADKHLHEKLFQVGDEFHSGNVNEDKHSRMRSSKERRYDEDMIIELTRGIYGAYSVSQDDSTERRKSGNEIVGCGSK
ncbi:RNA-directed DNA polymerase, partial [Tanacetum coccineum]